MKTVYLTRDNAVVDTHVSVKTIKSAGKDSVWSAEQYEAEQHVEYEM